jgi:carbohydrate-selective porin OprB
MRLTAMFDSRDRKLQRRFVARDTERRRASASLAWGDRHQRLRHVQSDEQMLELNYGVQATPWLLLRPTVQVVLRPGGHANRPDTSVFVLHVQATF